MQASCLLTTYTQSHDKVVMHVRLCQSCYKVVTTYFFFMGCLFSFWSKFYKNSLGTVVILSFACCTIKPGKITSKAHYKTVRHGNWLGI